MGGLPTGTVTFLFTDIEGSTRLLEHLGDDAYEVLLGEHHRILREAIAEHHGVEVSTEGDSFFVVFARAADAVATALAAQIALSRFGWPDDGTVRVRMGLHTGPGRLGGDSYVGLAVHQAARVSSAGHGGQVVVSEATRNAAGVLVDGASLRSLGRHRLKDLGAAVELFQLCHPELVAELPPLRSLESVAHNLPIQLSSFLGRDEELMMGAKLLAATRLLSVTGPGGTGKTRLAYQLAAEQLHEFPGGVWVAELAPVSDPELVPASLMAAVGLKDEPGRTTTETVVSHLRSRHALVVLDNCEHLVDDAAALTAALLRGCAQLRVLATSREPLRVAGESVWALRPLALPESTEMPLEALAGTDAVALFCERGAEAKVGFALSADNAPAVTQICARLEGIPLAIELAAARVRTLPLAQIAARLEHSLDLLSKGARGVVDRQASLRGTIAWSHDLLSPTEQTLFRRLAVFAGGFTLEGAEGVCAGEGLDAGEVVDTLDGLVDKSLVVLGQDRASEERYGLLETIRTYAAEQLERAGENQVLAGHHATYYSQLAHDCAEEGETVAALDRLDADHPNLLVALGHLSGCDRPIDHGQLVADVSSFWELRGHWQLARRELISYLDRPDRDRALEGHCVGHLGEVAFKLGDYPGARARYEEALAIARELGDRALEGRWIGGLGVVADSLGDYPGARAGFEEALAIARELGDRAQEGRCVGRLGVVALNLGDYPAARARFEEALAIARELGDRAQEGRCVGNLGELARNLGDYPAARARFEEALAIARELGDRRLEGAWIGSLGAVAVTLGDYAEARARFEEALAIARELGDRLQEGRCVGNLGNVALSLGDYPEARAGYEEALAIARELGDRRLEGFWGGHLGNVALSLGDYPAARARFEEALAIARELGDRRFEGYWIGSLGEVALALGDYPAARARFEEALSIARELDREDSDALENCAELLARLDHCEEAAEILAAVDNLNTRAHKVRAGSAQVRYAATLTTCREGLTEETLASASKRGGALDWASAADTALEFLGRV